MGKRKRGGLTGLSGFVSKAFGKDANAPATDNQDARHAHCPNAPSAATSHGTSTTISEGNAPTSNDSSSSKKIKHDGKDSGAPKRRWVKKYDVTGLVPHYSDVSEVPEHLQKCEPIYLVPILNAKRAISRFPSTHALLVIVLDASWMLAG